MSCNTQIKNTGDESSSCNSSTKRQESSKAATGWGSFHSEREDEAVDVLMNKTEQEYKPPVFKINTDISNYPTPTLNPPTPSSTDHTTAFTTASLTNTISFGEETKNKLFFLSNEFTFLNHGAFGAALRPVIDVARRWADHMESQPLRFIDRELLPLLVYTTRRMAKFVNVHPSDMVLLPNVTTGLNTILRSQKLTIDDRIVSLSIGYGSAKKMIQHVCDTSGAVADQIYVPLPLPSKKALLGQVARYLRKYMPLNPDGSLITSDIDDTTTTTTTTTTATTSNAADNEETETPIRVGKVKLAIFDSTTSNPGVTLPIKELTELCKKHHVPVLIDGAHSLGSAKLDISEIGCDYFVANAHKWLCSSKGCAIMYVARHRQAEIVPLTISHGYGSSFTSGFIWSGLQDYGPWLSLHACLDFYEKVGADNIYSYIRKTVLNAGHMLAKAWNTDLIAPDDMLGPMACVRLPGPRVPIDGDEANRLQDALYFKYNIEVPIKMLNNRLYVRLSAHIHNWAEEYNTLRDAMLELRPRFVTDEEDEKDAQEAENAELVVASGTCG